LHWVKYQADIPRGSMSLFRVELAHLAEEVVVEDERGLLVDPLWLAEAERVPETMKLPSAETGDEPCQACQPDRCTDTDSDSPLCPAQRM
jgi:hypothetical protein